MQDADDFDNDIAHLICVKLIPIAQLTQNTILKKWCFSHHKKTISSNYESVFSSCLRVESKMVERIKAMLDGKTPSICCDEWTSRTKKRFLNIQCYTDDKKISLGVARIKERCTGIELAKIIKEQLQKFNVHVQFMCTDGASNMTRCSFECGFQQVKCMLHGINLAVKDTMYSKVETQARSQDTDEDMIEFSTEEYELLASFDNLVKQVRSVATFFSRSGLASDSLMKSCEEIGIKFLTLNVDCVTRWSSLFTMVQVFIKLYPAICDTYTKMEKELNFTDSDLQALTVIYCKRHNKIF